MNKKLLALFLGTAISLTVIPLQALASSAPAQTAEIVQTVNFRDQPSTSGKRIRYLQPGETLEVMQTVNSSWLQVKDSKGVTGYVSSSSTYVRLKTAAAADKPNGIVLSSVSFRTGPSTDAARMRYLQKGELVLVLEKVNDYWYKIEDKDQKVGYVSTNAQYIDTAFGDNGDQQEPVLPSPPNATIVSSVSFRTEPNADASRIRYLQSGEKVLIINKVNDYWYNVQDQNGVTGYVSTSSKYISTTYVEPYKKLDHAVAADRVIAAGMNYLGTPYEFGSSRSDTSTFDCSDFVRQAYLDGIGQQLPGDSRSQADYVKSIGKTTADWHKLNKGDLMFFMSYKGYSAADYAGIDRSKETVTHVAIYLGDGKILHTYSQTSGGVRIDSIAGTQWENRFLQGGATY
ncbi:C40 family peptidase [Paenibacillus doosanensis]|uniref:Endopeptidase YafL n=1 Tax=Paenibacillus konkukensis TaxID=2020716 RepID=A0ABY4RMA9_9BACL|nr:MULTISPECIES: SH3 domain-containing C40 family peptidase [Paenibacillus]MCS7461779.1 C40 family peptidase [Paenibacillus doosanensis]UQZ83619.1 putative endopeptidase YafL precursor [Paenibacillus konkukensis]